MLEGVEGERSGRVWERGVVHSTHIRAWQSHGSDWIANRIVSCKQRGGRRVWTSAHRTQADDDRLQDGGDGGVMLNKDLAMAEGEGYGGDVVAATTESSVAALELNKLNFVYTGADGFPLPGCRPLFNGLDWRVERGSRVLLIGANGAGKTTVLKIIAGKHMVEKGSVLVLGSAPFHDTNLTSSGRLSYIGGTWQRDIAFAGYNVPLQGDIPAGKMIDGIGGVDPERKKRLMKVLDIDPNWRMHTVSEGQRRRVQLCVGLLKPFDVLLLDEVTVDLDVLGRADLMNFLAQECDERKCTIVYVSVGATRSKMRCERKD